MEFEKWGRRRGRHRREHECQPVSQPQLKAEKQAEYPPVGDAKPRNAVKLDHGRCAPGVAGESHGRDHEEDAEVGHNDKMALFSGEQDRVR